MNKKNELKGAGIQGGINLDKLSQYLKEEKIMEFESDEACRIYFNTYDCQNFKSIEEMKAYQGIYGFNIGEKRYHINYAEALDIWMSGQTMTNEFTDEELYVLADAMLSLIRTTSNALKQIYDKKSIDALQDTLKKYQQVNEKLCKMLK